MKTNLHLGFSGNCDQAFTFYEKVFRTERLMTMRWKDGPPEMKCPEGAGELIMHTALPVGGIVLMGADAPPGRGRPISGIDISIDDEDEAEVRRLFAELSDGGQVIMPQQPTFWSSLFGMCVDRFGVSWMISLPGQQ